MAWISFRLSEDEKEKVKQMAKDFGLSVSDYLRLQILNSPQLRRKKIQCREYEQLLREINKIGVNLNQIARYCNYKRDIDIAVLEALSRIEDELLKIVEQLPDPDTYYQGQDK